MTKKSLARQMRDEKEKDARVEANKQIKDNTIYDDIKQVYVKCGTTIIAYSTAFNNLCVDETVPLMTPEAQDKVKTLASGFKSDIETLTDDLVKINQPFVGKVGGEPNLDNFINTVGVIDQFSEFIGRAKNVLDPTFRAMAAEVSVVVDKQAQDPNVITDVEPKTIGVNNE